MKKRNCRMTQKEKDLHERAVRVRKMTDAQICALLDEPAFGGISPSEAKQMVKSFIEKARAWPNNGIGASTAAKLLKFLDEHYEE